MATKTKTKSALPWFGSAAGVAMKIGAELDRCSHVTILMAGGLPELPYIQARAVVANDLHELAIDFYDCMSGKHGERVKLDLIDCCNHTLSHPSHLSRAIRFMKHESILDRSWAFWATCWIGRKGKGGTKNQTGMPSIRRTAGGGTNATRIQSAANDLQAWAAEFERCEFECDHFVNVLKKVADKAGCGVYADAPWIGAGKHYLHKFNLLDHVLLAVMMRRFEHTKVVIRYGDDPVIRHLYRDFQITDVESRNQAGKKVNELLITNLVA